MLECLCGCVRACAVKGFASILRGATVKRVQYDSVTRILYSIQSLVMFMLTNAFMGPIIKGNYRFSHIMYPVKVCQRTHLNIIHIFIAGFVQSSVFVNQPVILFGAFRLSILEKSARVDQI